MGDIGPDDLSNDKNIAYTITSGFYPELASSISFGNSGNKAKGPLGAKYFNKRGFDNSSIKRIKHQLKHAGEKGYNEEGIPLAFQRKGRKTKKRNVGRRYFISICPGSLSWTCNTQVQP